LTKLSPKKQIRMSFLALSGATLRSALLGRDSSYVGGKLPMGDWIDGAMLDLGARGVGSEEIIALMVS
jgi:hypothetical protein